MSFVALTGTDEVRRSDAIRKSIKSWLQDSATDPLCIDHFSGSEWDLKKFAEGYEGMSLFSEKKVSLIKHFHRLRESQTAALQEILSQSNPDQCVIFIADKWKKTSKFGKWFAKQKGQLEDFKQPYSNQIPAWITSRAKESYGRNISNNDSHLLWEFIGDRLGELDQELKKLHEFVPKGNPITSKDIETLLSSHRIASYFELLKHFGLKNKTKTLEIIHHMQESGEPPFTISSRLFGHLIKLSQLKKQIASRSTMAEMASSIHLHEFLFKKERYLEQANRWNDKEIKFGLGTLSELEWKGKTGFFSQNFETMMVFASIL